MRTKPKNVSEAELFKLADELALTFWLPGTEARREQLRQDARAYWETIKAQPRVIWLTYLLRLLITCPPLFDRPAGYEWVLNQFLWELYYRKTNQSADRDFWEAVKRVRGAVRRGRPSDKARDYFRHKLVRALMKEKRLNKTKAVEFVAEREGATADARAIWKSLARVEMEQAARRKLMQR